MHQDDDTYLNSKLIIVILNRLCSFNIDIVLRTTNQIKNKITTKQIRAIVAMHAGTYKQVSTHSTLKYPKTLYYIISSKVLSLNTYLFDLLAGGKLIRTIEKAPSKANNIEDSSPGYRVELNSKNSSRWHKS